MIVGGLWISLAGALRHYRGVNETISSLLLTYIAIALFNHFVEGPLRDPASLNKPSTHADRRGQHGRGTCPAWTCTGACYTAWSSASSAYVLVRYTVLGFALRIVGGNVRAARLAGLPVGWLVLVSCFLGGAAAGLAGMVEVAAVHGSANASLIAGYGYTGILVSFIARHNPIADHAGGRAGRRHRSQRRLAAAAPRSARRHGAGAAGDCVHGDPRERDLVRAVQDLPAATQD